MYDRSRQTIERIYLLSLAYLEVIPKGKLILLFKNTSKGLVHSEIDFFGWFALRRCLSVSATCNAFGRCPVSGNHDGIDELRWIEELFHLVQV